MWWGHSRLVRGDRHRPNPSAATRRRVSIALAAIAVPLLAVTLWLGQQWQVELHELMGERTPDSYAWVRILLLGLVSFGLVVALVQALRWLVRTLAGRLAPVVPRHLARPLAVGLVAALVVGLNNGLVWRVLVEAANSLLQPHEQCHQAGRQPSGGIGAVRQPELTVILGHAGPPRQGLRGRGTEPGAADHLLRRGRHPARARLRRAGVVADDATADCPGGEGAAAAGGFDRSVLVVMTTTGTGLVEPANADALEHMYNGDSAIVAMQYSYLPS